MKLMLFTLFMLVKAHSMTLVHCQYTGYNADFGGSYYTGLYRSVTGNMYTYLFDEKSYSWCPYNMR